MAPPGRAHQYSRISLVKSILLDYGGTLDSDGVTWLERFRGIYKEAGLEASSASFDRAFYDADDGLPARFDLRGLSLEGTLRLQVGCVLEKLAPGRPELLDRVAGRFLEQSREAFRRNRPALERLAGRFRLGIVSNFYGNLDSVLASEGLAELFTVVADSAVVGHIKPAPELFEHALRAVGCGPAEALMVGDSIPRDMKGAESLAMPHALIAPAGKPSCCAQALRLTSFVELESRLGVAA